MSANFYDLLKCAVTGLASPDMTAYDKMRALATFGGGTVQTLTGQPPLTFKADGSPLISWSMSGNGQQTGTPTPDAPIMPTFCGVRTANLFEGAFGGSIGTTGGIAYSDQYEVYYARVTAGATYIISGGSYVYAYYSDIPSAGTAKAVDNTRHFTSQGNTITVIEGATWIGVRVNTGDKPMLNLGSTALPYEPYGYKIPFTCAGQTVPVYLGQTQTVRKIRKLVLTGEELWRLWNGNYYSNVIDKKGAVNTICCSHFIDNIRNGMSYDNLSSSGLKISASAVPFVANVTELIQWLADEYTAGHPVTIWYVLAEPTTGIVNEPLAKIGDYADELHSEDAGVTIPTAKGQNTLTVGTDLQPSEMMIVYQN